MREIKFRAWDVINEKMYPVAFPTWNGAVEGKINFVTHSVEMIDEDGDDKPVLMQFTGLVDKNGKEIFEGDIYKITAGPHFWIYQVKDVGGNFGNTLFGVLDHSNCSSNEADEYTFQITTEKAGLRDFVKCGRDCEIIGNIYETPELLTE